MSIVEKLHCIKDTLPDNDLQKISLHGLNKLFISHNVDFPLGDIMLIWEVINITRKQLTETPKKYHINVECSGCGFVHAMECPDCFGTGCSCGGIGLSHWSDEPCCIMCKPTRTIK